MAIVTIVTFAEDGTKTRIERTSYDYNTDGIRVSSLHEIDADADGNFETSKLTEYLNDPLNITGYSQVLKQTETNLETGEQANITYIIGRNKIAQITVKNGTEQEFYFTFDGHGSTRVLTDLAGAIVELYAFDAYGNAIGFDPSVALTEFLYSGEQFDSKIGQMYLRQRYYDPATGRFNRLDPFFGNLTDPQSLHKYLYTHADPVNGIDPSGLMSVGGMLGGLSIGNMMAAVKTAAVFAAKRFICGALSGMVIGGTVGGIDAALGKNGSFEDVLIEARRGAIMGFVLGGSIAALGTFVPTAAITALGVAVGVPLTAIGVSQSVQEGNYVQAGWRIAGGMIISRFLYRLSGLFCFAEGTEVITYDPEYYQYLTKQLDVEKMEVISNSSTNPIMSHKMALFLSAVYAVYQITKIPTKKTSPIKYNNIKKLLYFYQNLNNIVR